MIGIDAYRVPYVPWHLTTVEFFQEVRDHLTEDGVVTINVGRTDNDRRLVEAMAHTLSDVFPSVYTLDVPNSYNTILFATRQPTTADNLRANLATLPSDAHPMLRQVLTVALDSLRPTVFSAMRFTDDRAPVEMIVDSMVVQFLMGGGLNELN
jgi:hypothetical protein